jgi:hypothetical protein
MRQIPYIFAGLILVAVISTAQEPAETAPQEEAQPAVHGDFSSGWNTWQETAVGDAALYRTIDGSLVQFQLAAIGDDGTLTIVITELDADGAETSRREVHAPVSDAPCHFDARAPEGDSVEWSTEEYEMSDVALSCHVMNWHNLEASGSKWFSRDVPCGGAVMLMLGDGEVTWLVSYTRGGRTVSVTEDEEPPREETPDEGHFSGYGNPIALNLPDAIRRDMRDQGTSIARLRLYFRENQQQGGIALEFEGMRTEVPVIYAAFEPEQCDRELTYEEWIGRDGHYVDLGFDVKSRPRRLKGLEVKIEHRHMKGDSERVMATFTVATPPPGEPWDPVRLRGALPGINRYTLVVSYTDSEGKTSTQRGFSHWVLVSSPPMFDFRPEVKAIATRTQAGELALLNAEVSFRGSFELHDGLAPEDCTVRIVRRGRRTANLSGISADVRRVVEKDVVPPGWHEIGRFNLSPGETRGAAEVKVDGASVIFELKHGFAASSSVLPVSEDWEYGFELHHRPSREVLAQWSWSVAMSLRQAQQLDDAQLLITGTGLRQPLEVPFARR